MTPENTIISRQVQRHRAREVAKYGKANVQTALNNVLWRIVMNNGGTLSIPRYEMDQVPPEAAIEATFDSTTNSLIIRAMLRVNTDGIVSGG